MGEAVIFVIDASGIEFLEFLGGKLEIAIGQDSGVPGTDDRYDNPILTIGQVQSLTVEWGWSPTPVTIHIFHMVRYIHLHQTL